METPLRHPPAPDAPRRGAVALAGRAVGALALLALGVALWPGRIASPPSPEGARGDAALESELAALRVRLAAEPRAPQGDGPAPALAELTRRVDALARELESLRRREGPPPAPPQAPASAPAPAAGGLAALERRVEQLELRQQRAESERTALEGGMLARVEAVEARQEALERSDAGSLRALLERVGRLEGSQDQAESRRLEGQGAILARLAALESRLEQAPAAPQP